MSRAEFFLRSSAQTLLEHDIKIIATLFLIFPFNDDVWFMNFFYDFSTFIFEITFFLMLHKTLHKKSEANLHDSRFFLRFPLVWFLAI